MTDSFGKWMKQTRKRLNMTSAELGEMLGVTGSYILQIENGQKECPQKRLDEIGKAFGMEHGEIEQVYNSNAYERTYKTKQDDALVEYDAGFKNMTVTIEKKPPLVISLSEKQSVELQDYFDTFGW